MNVFYVETIQKKPVFISLNRVVMVFISVMSAQINRGDVLWAVKVSIDWNAILNLGIKFNWVQQWEKMWKIVILSWNVVKRGDLFVWECVGGSLERAEKGSREGLGVRGRVDRVWWNGALI